MAAISLTACGSKDDSSGANKTEIKYFSFSASPDYEEPLKKMVADFEKENPKIKVDIELAPYDTYFTKLQTLLAGGKAPDVYEMNYENFVSYAAKGQLLDVSDKTKDLDLTNINEMAFNAYSYQGKQYGLTESFSNVVTFYNKDLFDKAGVKYPTSDWTWEDETEAAKKLTDAGAKVYGTYSPITMNEFYKVAAQNGGSIYDKDGKLTINSQENIDALQHMVDLVTKQKVTPSPAEMSGQNSEDLFMNGQLAIVHTGIWMFGTFKDAPFKWDIQVEAGNINKATHFFANGLVIDKDTKKADAAYKFAEFMSTSDTASKLRVDNSWDLPINTSDAVLKPYLEQTPPSNREAVFKSLDYLVLPPATEDWAKLSATADQEFEKVVLGKASAKEALDSLQKQFQ
ncbi:MAG: sugar ABC transporter substrate-binding protein [Streptococcaceae bacterium]|nr:sugar ABC transporter substrate-binding protein [Streptococcaceae bacterium]